MNSFRTKASFLAVCCATLLLASGCGSNSAPTGPLDPALTGKWIIPSVDTWLQLTLEQRGAAVSGTFGYYSPVASPDTYILSGTATLPHVLLTWTQDGNVETFDAVLSANQDTLSGTIDGGSGVTTFRRDRQMPGKVTR